MAMVRQRCPSDSNTSAAERTPAQSPSHGFTISACGSIGRSIQPSWAATQVTLSIALPMCATGVLIGAVVVGGGVGDRLRRCGERTVRDLPEPGVERPDDHVMAVRDPVDQPLTTDLRHRVLEVLAAVISVPPITERDLPKLGQ